MALILILGAWQLLAVEIAVAGTVREKPITDVKKIQIAKLWFKLLPLCLIDPPKFVFRHVPGIYLLISSMKKGSESTQ